MVVIVFFFVLEDHTVPFGDHLGIGMTRFGTPQRPVAPYDRLDPDYSNHLSIDLNAFREIGDHDFHNRSRNSILTDLFGRHVGDGCMPCDGNLHRIP